MTDLADVRKENESLRVEVACLRKDIEVAHEDTDDAWQNVDVVNDRSKRIHRELAAKFILFGFGGFVLGFFAGKASVV